MAKLLVINPNSNTDVTDHTSHALEKWRRLGITIECVTNRHGPDTISSDQDVARASRDVVRVAGEMEADAILVACFSDPGAEQLRQAIARPVFGIQEAAILMAMARAPRFGIIALSEHAVPRHMARMDMLGFMPRCAGELGLSGYSALAVGQDDDAFAESLEAGERLKRMGAGAIILGCAGFGRRRAALEAALAVPVIDPVLAGVAVAMGALVS